MTMMSCRRRRLCWHALAAPALEAAEKFLGFNSNTPGGKETPMTREHDVFFQQWPQPAGC